MRYGEIVSGSIVSETKSHALLGVKFLIDHVAKMPGHIIGSADRLNMIVIYEMWSNKRKKKNNRR